jgi:hypothetical protein
MRIVLASVLLGACALAGPAASATSGTAIPDFSGLWWHPSLPGPEPLSSGPTSVRNLRRAANGAGDYNVLVGDYNNPILKPEASAIVKKFGEISNSGVVFPNPANSCWPEPGPFIYKNFAIRLLPQGDHITIIYDQDHEVRRVRMNQQHPKNVKPSWYGDSVGHYEGDTLVVDTVGIKVDRPFAMVDLYGTPYTKALHMVERYRLIDSDMAKEALDRNVKENFQGGGGRPTPDPHGKYLQIFYTIEDPGVFTTPWSATVTYSSIEIEWPETACAENPHTYYDKDTQVPMAENPDF